MRASFKLRNLLYDSEVSVTTSLKLFDQLVKPICMYGSEIWGYEFNKKNILTSLFSSVEKALCEKVHISFCRFILGVHKKSQLSAIRGELGRTPLALEALANSLHYYKYLCNKSPTTLLSCAFKTSAVNHCVQSHKFWHGQIIRLKELLGNASARSRKSVLHHLRSLYSTHWWDKIHMESKMRTYTQFKSNLVMEDYLDIPASKHRKEMTRLRISAHRLAIERGRYNNTPLEERTCPTCEGQIIEDELAVSYTHLTLPTIHLV